MLESEEEQKAAGRKSLFLNYISLQDRINKWINKWISKVISLQLNRTTLQHRSPEDTATQLIGVSHPCRRGEPGQGTARASGRGVSLHTCLHRQKYC